MRAHVRRDLGDDLSAQIRSISEDPETRAYQNAIEIGEKNSVLLTRYHNALLAKHREGRLSIGEVEGGIRKGAYLVFREIRGRDPTPAEVLGVLNGAGIKQYGPTVER